MLFKISHSHIQECEYMQQNTILIESRPEMSNFLHGTFVYWAVVFYVFLGKLCSIDIRYK